MRIPSAWSVLLFWCVATSASAEGLAQGPRAAFAAVADDHAEATRAYRGRETSTLREARRLYMSGVRAFRGGRFELALGLWKRSLALVRNPAVLLQIATAADRLRQDEEAARALRQYLALSPETSRREEIEARIRILEDSAFVRDDDRMAARRPARRRSTLASIHPLLVEP